MSSKEMLMLLRFSRAHNFPKFVRVQILEPPPKELLITSTYIYIYMCVLNFSPLQFHLIIYFFLFILILFGYVRICSRVIWLGDLNYRVALSYEKTRLLLEDNDWDSLLEKDQVIGFVMRTNLNK